MSIVSAKEILVEAAKGQYAIGAFSISNLVQLEGVVDAAVENKSPVIIQASAAVSKFLGAEVLAAIYRAIASSAPAPMCLELNRCAELDYSKKCAELGYTSIACDASSQPFEENVRKTCEIAEHCHRLGGVSVEATLGLDSTSSEASMPDTRQVVQFVMATGADVLAPAANGTASKINVEQMAAINRALNESDPKTPLAVHASVGLPETSLKRLIQAGAAKLNVHDALKRTLIDAQYDYLVANRQEYEPGKIDIAIRDAIRKVAGQWMRMLGSVGKA
jgi:fructose/tagatose bisphosphate aldolase